MSKSFSRVGTVAASLLANRGGGAMIRARLFAVAMAIMLGAVALIAPQRASAQSTKPTIVLVHGAWADGSSWNGVIAPLLKAGFTVYAPPNPLRGLASDAASLEAFLKTIPGPVILVGHSYGGAVTSVASANDANVKALVFVDAFVPDGGESCLSLLAGGPPPPKDLFTPVSFATATVGDTDLYLTRKYYGPVFASDVPPELSSLMASRSVRSRQARSTKKRPQPKGGRRFRPGT
jgi:pimeloyl-ACP methyl ester carboxylesterase